MGKKKPHNLNLPQKPNQQQNQIIQAVRQQFSGPLPHPAVLEHYNKIVPNAADRIIQMAESQAKHRQHLEDKVVQSDMRDGRLGLHYALIIGMSGIIGSTLCIMFGHTTGGSILGASTITSLVGAFIYGSRQRRNEREERVKMQLNT